MLSKQERRSLGEIGRALATDGFSLPTHLLPVRPTPLSSGQRLIYDVVTLCSVILAAVCFMLAGSGGVTGAWVASVFAAVTLGVRIDRSNALDHCAGRVRAEVSGTERTYE